MSNYNSKTMQSQVIAQWITSLAISVICCAILFIVFAGYIVDLHERTNLEMIKIEVLQERISQLQSEITFIKRTPVVHINTAPPPLPPQAERAVQDGVPPTPDSVQINEQDNASDKLEAVTVAPAPVPQPVPETNKPTTKK